MVSPARYTRYRNTPMEQLANREAERTLWIDRIIAEASQHGPTVVSSPENILDSTAYFDHMEAVPSDALEPRWIIGISRPGDYWLRNDPMSARVVINIMTRVTRAMLRDRNMEPLLPHVADNDFLQRLRKHHAVDMFVSGDYTVRTVIPPELFPYLPDQDDLDGHSYWKPLVWENSSYEAFDYDPAQWDSREAWQTEYNRSVIRTMFIDLNLLAENLWEDRLQKFVRFLKRTEVARSNAARARVRRENEARRRELEAGWKAEDALWLPQVAAHRQSMPRQRPLAFKEDEDQYGVEISSSIEDFLP